MICNSFFPVCGMSFHFLDSVLWYTKVVILMKSNLFLFCCSCFWCHLTASLGSSSWYFFILWLPQPYPQSFSWRSLISSKQTKNLLFLRTHFKCPQVFCYNMGSYEARPNYNECREAIANYISISLQHKHTQIFMLGSFIYYRLYSL